MLRELLSTNVFQLFLVFARIGAAMMFLPALGGALVPVRTRLLLALFLALAILPVLSSALPPQPTHPMAMAVLFISEITIGIFFGMITQALMAALELAGNFIGTAVGLTNAFVFDAVSQEQAQLITGFLNTAAITLMLITDTHHLMIRALVDTYSLFTPGQPLPMGDFSSTLTNVVGKSFSVGTQLASPLIIFGVIFNSGLGLLNRLVPQMQVFFVGMPVQIVAGLTTLMFALPAIFVWFMHHLADGVGAFLSTG